MKTPNHAHPPIARAARVLVVLTALVAMTLVGVPGAAAASCGSLVINDWYDDGRVDGTYALHCYDDAIEILPRDVRDYSSAKEDIERALQAKRRGEPAPPATTDPSPDGEGSGGTGSGGTDDPTAPGGEAVPPVGESASSVPVPLLILAGLALLLVVGGSAGYVVRRLQSRRIPPPAL